MSTTSNNSQDIRSKLRDSVINKLFNLPAFRLREKQVEIVKSYAVNQLSTSINKLQISSPYFHFSNSIYQNENNYKKAYLDDLKGLKGLVKENCFCLRMFPNSSRIYLVITVILFVTTYFLIKDNSLSSKLIGVFSILAAVCFYFLFITKALISYTVSKSTFNVLSGILQDIEEYINDVDLIEKNTGKSAEENLEGFSKKIVEEYIYQEIRRVSFNVRKINFVPIFLAFFMSLVVVYITGDLFVDIIKTFAKWLNILEAFPAIKNMGVQELWLFFLFPTFVAWSRDAVVEVSKNYNKELYRSLFLIKPEDED